jgi:hypothetical protein
MLNGLKQALRDRYRFLIPPATIALPGRTNLILVAEMEGCVRALGGIATYEDSNAAALSFGMVHPGYQRKRLGTVLVLARLAALPEPPGRWVVAISTTGGSHTFFKRFGFWGLVASPTNLVRYSISTAAISIEPTGEAAGPLWQKARSILRLLMSPFRPFQLPEPAVPSSGADLSLNGYLG